MLLYGTVSSVVVMAPKRAKYAYLSLHNSRKIAGRLERAYQVRSKV